MSNKAGRQLGSNFSDIFTGCRVSWTTEENTDILNGEVNSADCVEDCQSACINNASCDGVDWDLNPGVQGSRRCLLSGPWSGGKRPGQAAGITHYNLIRNYCTGKNCTSWHKLQYRYLNFS